MSEKLVPSVETVETSDEEDVDSPLPSFTQDTPNLVVNRCTDAPIESRFHDGGRTREIGMESKHICGLVEKMGYPMWGPTWGRLWGTTKNLQTGIKIFLVLRCREYLTHRKKFFLKIVLQPFIK